MKYILTIIIFVILVFTDNNYAQTEISGYVTVRISIVKAENPEVTFEKDELILDVDPNIQRSFLVNYSDNSNIPEINPSKSNRNLIEIKEKLVFKSEDYQNFLDPCLTIVY